MTQEKLDQIITELGQLTKTVQDHKTDPATIEIDKLAGDVEEMSKEITKLKADLDEANRKGQMSDMFANDLPVDPEVKTGKFAGKKLSELMFVKNFLKQAKNVYPDGVKAPSEELNKLTESPEAKLLTATGSGTGDELVPQNLAAELWMETFLQSRVVNSLMTIPMPTDPFVIPLGWGSINWRKGVEGEATDAQDPSTADSTLTSTEQVAEVNWSYNLDEDAVIAVMPTLRTELARSGAEQIDAFALNADSTNASSGNINLDDSTPATDAYYLSAGQDGIRHYYLVDQTGQSTDISTTLTDALWRAGLARMGKYAVDPSQVVAFTNAKTYLLSLMSLDDVRTLDKYGPMATILTGELAKMDGVPIVVSESMPLAEDDGKVSATAGNNDEGQIALVHRPSWKVGFRRQMLMEVDRDIRKRKYIMVVSFRIALAARNRTGTHTAGIHGITYS